ncbi:MAG: Neutral ceramidase precursor [Candidatus Hydrogenedentes bacterium ADurb.Bin101]|nr:MAG: Neutral ceramidase precursor [Candidatus Hydrogenedentes bacterium ADurb.Bin101]
MKINAATVSRRSFLRYCGGTALGTALSMPAVMARGDVTPFRAGIACVDITPELPVSMVGGFRDRTATGVHDPLHARCIVLDNGEAQLALVMVDNCLIQRPVFEAAKKRIQDRTGLSPDRVLAAATHTHTGVTVTSVFQSDPVPGYADFLAERIAEAVDAAVEALEPAQIAWGSGAVPGEVFNRRWYMKDGTIPPNPFGGTTDKVQMNPPRASENLVEPSGPTDPTVSILALRRPDGTPLAILANYSLHYVGDTEAAVLSADYYGFFADKLAALMAPAASGKPFLAMMSNGTSGNINNVNFREAGVAGPPYSRMSAVAESVANEVFQRYQELEFKDTAVLASATREITLGVRKPAAGELERARAIVAAAEGPDMKTSEEVFARESILLADFPDAVPVPLQALRIGDLGIAAIPCEVFVEIGLALRNESPFKNTFTIELANGYNGYLPTAEHHALGGYETWRARSSYLEVAAAEKIQETMRALLAEVKS